MKSLLSSLAIFFTAMLASNARVAPGFSPASFTPPARTNSAPKPPSSPTKRALLIGINQYNAAFPPQCCGPAQKNCNPDDQKPTPGPIQNLCGPVFDIKSFAKILEKNFDFDPANVHVLLDSQASRKNILDGIDKFLNEDAKPGDLSVFIYAGHGSQRFNSLSDKPGHWDQTIVPQDVVSAHSDPILDKELAAHFKGILKKGILLTAVFDSCYSGAVTRGIPRGGVARFAFADNRDAKIAPDTGPNVEQLGAVVLAAAQPDESAYEKAGDSKNFAHGAFSSSLGRALTSLPPDAPAADVIRVTTSLMLADGWDSQHPKLGGAADKPLFSFVGAKRGPLTLAVAEIGNKGDIKLDGGMELGLGPGSIFKQKGTPAGQEPIVLRLSDASSIGSSTAVLVSGNPQALKVGELFALDKMAVAETQRLRVWAPKPLPESKLQIISAEIAKLKKSGTIDWIDDPIKQSPTHFLEWDGANWNLLSWNDKTQKTEKIGPEFSAVKILSTLQASGAKNAKLFANIPPSTEFWSALTKELSLGAENSYLEESPRSDAHYVLVGRAAPNGIEYAWILPNAVQDPNSALLAAPEKGDNLCSANTPLPLRTDWVSPGSASDSQESAASELGSRAMRLSRIVLLQSLTSPPPTDFPYHLRLKNAATGALLSSGTVREGETYGYSLLLNESELSYGIQQRWVYVFTVGCDGSGLMTFPSASSGNTFNHIPLHTQSTQTEVQSEIPLVTSSGGQTGRFCVSEPFGLDTHFLLTSDQPIKDLSVFNFGAVLTRGGGVNDPNPLTHILGGIQSGTRGASLVSNAAPPNWSIERIHVESVPDKDHPCK